MYVLHSFSETSWDESMGIGRGLDNSQPSDSPVLLLYEYYPWMILSAPL